MNRSIDIPGTLSANARRCAVALLLAACAGGDDGATTATSTGGSTSTSTAGTTTADTASTSAAPTTSAGSTESSGDPSTSSSGSTTAAATTAVSATDASTSSSTTDDPSTSTSTGCEPVVWYADTDGDTYGDPDASIAACDLPPGYVDNDLDCDDTDPDINPDTTWYADMDMDGYGDEGDALTQCDPPPGRVLVAGDCDDTSDKIGPQAMEATCADLGVDLNCDGQTAPLCASCFDLLEDGGVMDDGVYTIDPNGGDPADAFAVHCDMTTDGGGWTLLMRITGSSTSHVYNNTKLGPSPCLPDGVSCRLATATISAMLATPGLAVLEIRPDEAQFISWYVRAASDTAVWPTNLDCSNRAALLADPNTAWVLTSYQTDSDAVAGVNGDLGTYTGQNHHYPTPYAPEQIFFKGNTTGLRVNTAWSSQCCNDGRAGTLWIR